MIDIQGITPNMWYQSYRRNIADMYGKVVYCGTRRKRREEREALSIYIHLSTAGSLANQVNTCVNKSTTRNQDETWCSSIKSRSVALE